MTESRKERAITRPFANDLKVIPLELIAFPIGSYGKKKKNLPAMWETWVQSLGRENPLGKGIANRSHSLENSMDRGAWRAIVHGAAKSWT